MHEPGAIHFVTNRCFQEMLLMLPSATINEIILYWLARAMAKYGSGIQIFAFAFLSNHFHLLLKDTVGQLAQFMCYFQGNVAKAINRELGRHDKFWSREYDDMIVDGEAEFWDRWCYTTCNPVKANLVAKAADWEGVTSFAFALHDRTHEIVFMNNDQYKAAKRRGQKVRKADCMQRYTFRLSPPPGLEEFSPNERYKYFHELIRSAEKKYEIAREGKPVMGLKKIRQQSPFDRPKASARSPRVKFFCFDVARRNELYRKYYRFVDTYKQIFGGYRKASLLGRRPAIEWPIYSYPPALWTPTGYHPAYALAA